MHFLKFKQDTFSLFSSSIFLSRSFLLSLPLFFFFSLILEEAFAFTDNECLDVSFEVEVSHKDGPMGLSNNVLTVAKKGCVIDLYHKSLWFFNKHYIIDICRAPVHIKIENGGIDVVKRDKSCKIEMQEEPMGDYCMKISEIENIILDDGLIFAPGEKEKLKDDHGKMNCAYLLLDAYLARGIVFSKENQYENVIVVRENLSREGSGIYSQDSSLTSFSENQGALSLDKKQRDASKDQSSEIQNSSNASSEKK